MKWGFGFIAALWMKPRIIIHFTPFIWGLMVYYDSTGEDGHCGLQLGPLYFTLIV